jgi:ribosomal protein S12 methylthiotransferase
MRSKTSNNRINIVTLGCSKNLVDSEVLMKQLHLNGIRIEHNSNSLNFDTIIINTCGFIKDAKEESINTILQYAKLKESGKIKNLYVIGCLSERYKNELSKEIPDVNKYFGTNNLKEIIEFLGFNYKDNLINERFLTTPSHYAYLKISEGCDRSCSFCAIPLIRGQHQSKPIENIILETQKLVDTGVKELILIAQDLTYYGVDLYRKQKLPELVEQLSEIKGLEWIRLHYAYPSGFPLDLLKVIRNKSNICNYLDIPFQHISKNVLNKMRRGITSEQIYKLIQKIKEEVPNITLRTTLMVGHPGEDEKEFQKLIDFIEQIQFDRLGVFAYSEEEDTFGAKNFKDIIPEETKQLRVDKIMGIQSFISHSINSKKIGETIKVLIDRLEGDQYIGRSESDSPEIDNEVLISNTKKLKIGEFYNVKIYKAEEFDLIAEPV